MRHETASGRMYGQRIDVKSCDLALSSPSDPCSGGSDADPAPPRRPHRHGCRPRHRGGARGRQPRALRHVDARRGPGPAAGGRDDRREERAPGAMLRRSPRSSSRWSRASRRCGTRSCARRARAPSCRRRATVVPRHPADGRRALRGAPKLADAGSEPRRRPRRRGGRLLALGRLGAFAGPRLVELDAPACRPRSASARAWRGRSGRSGP